MNKIYPQVLSQQQTVSQQIKAKQSYIEKQNTKVQRTSGSKYKRQQKAHSNQNTQAKSCLSQQIHKQGELLTIQDAIYKPSSALICSFHLHIDKQQIILSQIQKIKIFPNKISTKYYEFKINVKCRQYYFAASSQSKSNEGYPEHFQWFMCIINSRLKNTEVEVQVDSKGQSKNSEEARFISGQILKKSKYLKKWQKRFALMSNQGFHSFKDPKDSNHSHFVKSSTVTQIWTRFELIENKRFIIMKLMHGDHQKAQYGLSLSSINQKQKTKNWLYQFYRMMQQGKGNKIQT